MDLGLKDRVAIVTGGNRGIGYAISRMIAGRSGAVAIWDMNLDGAKRAADRIALVEAYAKAQGMLREATSPDPAFTDTIELDLATVAPSLAGPKRPEGRVTLEAVGEAFPDFAIREVSVTARPPEGDRSTRGDDRRDGFTD